jgi:hypothetical protein
MGLNREDAEAAAVSAYSDTWRSLERQLQDGLQWTGEPAFLKHITAHIVYRIKDARRQHYRRTNRLDDLLGDPEEARTARLERLTPVAPNQGAPEDPDEAVALRTEMAVGHIVTTLATWKEVCRMRKRKALVAVLDAQLEYIRHCVAKAVTNLGSERHPEAMTLDELLPYLDPDAFHASQPEMSQFIMDALTINRGTLDTRRKQIRELVEGSGRPPAASR